MGQRRIKFQLEKKSLETNKNENRMYHNLLDAKSVLKGKFVAINV